MIAFVLLAELWNVCQKHKKSPVPKEDITYFRKYFLLSYDDRQEYNFAGLIQKIRAILEKSKADLFVKEINDLPKFDDLSTDFGSAIAYLEDLKNTKVEALEKNEIHQKCIKGEEMLSFLLVRLAFIIQYSIWSVKSIDVHNYRHSTEPNFSHRIVKLVQTLVNKLQDRQRRKRRDHVHGLLFACLKMESRIISISLLLLLIKMLLRKMLL